MSAYVLTWLGTIFVLIVVNFSSLSLGLPSSMLKGNYTVVIETWNAPLLDT